MIPQQVIHTIDASALLERTAVYTSEGWRLVQICATTLDCFEMSYSFTLGDRFEHLRISVPLDNPVLPSITDHYFGAFAYENEIHDLFGVNFTGLRLDYAGNFFKMSVKKPFATSMCVIKTEPRGDTTNG